MVSARVLLLAPLVFLATAPAAARQDPARTDGWVVISVDDYRALRMKAFPVDEAPPPPPVDAAVTRIDYDLAVGSEAVTGTAAMTVDVFKEGWVAIRVPSGLLVSEARVDGRPVSLVDHASPTVLLSKRGRSVVTLRLVLPLTSSSTDESLTIPPAAATTTQVTLTMPRVGVELSATNAWIASSAETAGHTRWTAYGRHNEALTFAWRRRVDTRRAEQKLRLRGGVTHLVGVGEDGTQVTAAVRVDVVSGLASEVALSHPSNLQVTRVTGGTVGDWDTPAPGQLRVRLLEATSNAIAFTVSGEVRGPSEGPVSVPLVRLANVEREIGGVAVEVLGAGEITGRQAVAMDPADPLDLGGVVAGRESPSMVAYRFKPLPAREPRTLDVHVVRYETQAVVVANVDEARYQVLSTEDGKTLVRARFAVRNNHRSLLSAALPADAVLWSTSVAGRVVRPGVSPTGALLIPLERGRGGDLPPFVVEIAYLARVQSWPAKGTLRLPMPAIDLPISRTGVILHYSPRFKLVIPPGSFRAEPYAEPVTAVLREPAVPPPSGAASSPGVKSLDDASKKDLDALLESARRVGGRLPGILPLDVTFPDFGSTIYLAAELTPEMQLAALDLEFERSRGN